ncbi:hypothetical protein HPB52_010381 [Rhipicephalus sanguineus]|uniref:Uncharacterized protein n=1 Tax=Rhipicephalus sanguineus TaxID=34632 RepID=A0A9D4QD76_RHISA|nr:hypothetical protein HPB52_010381 [Rhipicephalus sanguineus]
MNGQQRSADVVLRTVLGLHSRVDAAGHDRRGHLPNWRLQRGALASFRVGPRSRGRPRLVGCSVAHECPPSGLQPSHRKARTSTDRQADVATQQTAYLVISAKEKEAGDAKTERYPQERNLAEKEKKMKNKQEEREEAESQKEDYVKDEDELVDDEVAAKGANVYDEEGDDPKEDEDKKDETVG